MMYAAGIDFGEKEQQEYAVLDADGRVVRRGRVPETRTGLRRLINELTPYHCDDEPLMVGIEAPDRLIAIALRDEGFNVVHINPAMIKKMRESEEHGGDKDDKLDAKAIPTGSVSTGARHARCRCTPTTLARSWPSVAATRT